MRKNVAKFLYGGILCLAVTLPSASAQYAHVMKVDVPFEFLMDGRVFPAGRYTVSANVSSPVVTVSSEDHRWNIMRLTDGAQRPEANERAQLVFTRYGSDYVMAQMWFAGTQHGRELRKDSRTRELAKRFTNPSNTTVAAVLPNRSGTRIK